MLKARHVWWPSNTAEERERMAGLTHSRHEGAMAWRIVNDPSGDYAKDAVFSSPEIHYAQKLGTLDDGAEYEHGGTLWVVRDGRVVPAAGADRGMGREPGAA